MAVLVLNRRRIVRQIPRWLEDLQEPIVLVTARSVVASSELERGWSGYAEVVVVDDYDGPDVDHAVTQLAERHELTRIASTAEFDVLRSARYRRELDIRGQGMESARAYRDKLDMKSRLAEGGVAIAPMAHVRRLADITAFTRRHGYPIVCKPVSGAGSVGVRLVESEAAAASACREYDPDEGFITEAWIEGDMYEVDGLLAAGSIVHAWPARMRVANLDVVLRSEPLSTWTLPVDHKAVPELRALVDAVVAVLPAPDEVTAFHAEVFCSADGRLVLNEIACRAGGAGIVPMYERAFGVNLLAASLRGQCGLDIAPPPIVPAISAAYVWFPPRAGVVRELPRSCPIEGVYSFSLQTEGLRSHDAPTSISDHVAEVLVDGPAGDDLDARIAAIEQWWASTVSWV